MSKILSFILLVLSLNLHAEEKIQGFIVKKEDAIFLTIEPGKTYSLEATAIQDSNSLRELESGDFIVGAGDIIGESIKMESLHFVGLRKIIGLWRTDDWELFEFRNFEDLLLLWPELATEGIFKPSPIKSKSYNYTLAPATAPFWSMILVSDTSVDLARLTFTHEKLIIELLHRDQNDTQRTFILSPLTTTAHLQTGKTDFRR